ncbi:MAG: RIP metalloprotease RseP [Myxococcota bacterium]
MMYLQFGLAALLMITALVVIHEFGHFIAARVFGVGTEVFSVGVGPRLWGFRLWDTDFRISAFPIGGYVQMSGADPFGNEHDEMQAWVAPERDFMRKPVWQRLIIMLAGPVMNLGLAVVLITVVLMAGEPKLQAKVGILYPGGAAEGVGIRYGDHILAADGHPIDVWDDLQIHLEDHLGEPVELTVQTAEDPPRKVTIPGESVRVAFDGNLDLFELGFTPLVRSSLVGVVDPDSPAGRAGLRSGDAVVKVDGAEIRTWVQLTAALAPGVPHTIERLRAEEEGVSTATATLTPDPAWAAPEWVADASRPMADAWGLEPPVVVVGAISPRQKRSGCSGGEEVSRAEAAGVQVGDRMVRIDGSRIDGWSDVLRLVAATARPGEPPRELTLDLIREGEPVSLTFQPSWESDVARHGVVNLRPLMGIRQYPGVEIALDLVPKYYSLPAAAARAVEETGEDTVALVRLVWNMVSGQVSMGDYLGGPVAIVRQAGEAAQAGVFRYVKTMAIISLSLGVLNLMPFPLLDGGQIVFYLIEGIRGRPVSPRVREPILMLGGLALMALILYVTVNDVSRWIGG